MTADADVPGKGKKQLPCRPPAGVYSKIESIKNRLGISWTGTVTYLLIQGIELDEVRIREADRAKGLKADAAFWDQALPYLRRKAEDRHAEDAGQVKKTSYDVR